MFYAELLEYNCVVGVKEIIETFPGKYAFL